jgi:electron transport complex protein RnfE
MRDELGKGFWRENPVFVQALGMCPTLAVTNSATNALAMGLATTAVLLASGMVISSIRHRIPKQARIATFILIIATFVTCVDYGIQALNLTLHAALGAFISLIVVNCLILGRMEAFASKRSIGDTLLDGLGMGGGFTLALLCLGSVREILGEGALFGMRILPAAFEPWVVMLLPGGGFFVLALWVLVFNRLRQPRDDLMAEDVAPGGPA